MMLRSNSLSILAGKLPPAYQKNEKKSKTLHEKDNKAMKDMSVRDITPDAVPLYAYDGKRRKEMRKVRSFGEFTVPDVEMNEDSSSDGSDSRPNSPSHGVLDENARSNSPPDVNNRSLFDHHVCTGWDQCVKLQKFKYDLSSTESRILPGTLGFVAQLNEGRATQKRQTEFRVDKVAQPFDENRFNFNKISGSEVLFRFEPVDNDNVAQINSVFVSEWEEPPHVHASPNLVIINVSPIEYGHILLVPRVKDNLPQQVTPSTMRFALHMAAESNNPFFRIGFNSLGAYGSVNHLHFQGYYLDAPFPVERAPTVEISGVSVLDTAPYMKNVKVTRLTDYPVRGIVMEVDHARRNNANDSLRHLANICGRACMKLAAENIPHNLFIVDGGSRVFLFPQCFQSRTSSGCVPDWILDTGVNPAAFEISGHLLMKKRVDFDLLSENKACKLLEEVSFNEKDFMAIVKICFDF